MNNIHNNQNQSEETKYRINEIDKKNQNLYETNLQNQNHEEFNYFVYENKYHIDIEIIKKKINVFQCRKCKTEFFFNNKLHCHI